MVCLGWLEKLLFAWPGHVTFCRTQSRFRADIVSSVVGTVERRSHLPDCISCIPPSFILLHKSALTADLSSSLDLESHTAGVSESEVWFSPQVVVMMFILHARSGCISIPRETTQGLWKLPRDIILERKW